jgi:hypothetical protein
MAQYFFDRVDGISVFDRQGLLLPDQKTAEKHAVGLAQSFRSRGPKPLFIVVTDSEGTELYRTPVAKVGLSTEAAPVDSIHRGRRRFGYA